MVYVAVALVAVSVVGALAVTQGGKAGPHQPARQGGESASFTVENLRPGQPTVSLEALRGKPVVLNFWASWCVPCRREMPAFEQVHRSLGDRVAFLGIASKDYRDSALNFLNKTGVSYPSGFDQSGALATKFGVMGMPTTVFISPDGTVLDTRIGEVSREELERTISRLFAVP
jgi:cytochrome c biogenesis protein CcmG, thiol:disulfide interchange protein DsbE